MKTSKSNGLTKLVSFVLLAVILIFAVGIAVGGWQQTPTNKPDSGDVGELPDDTDENTDGQPDNGQGGSENGDVNQGENDPPIITEPPQPKYYSQITGIEITKEQFDGVPLGFVLNPLYPLYGISNSDITFEFPIEDGSTRLLTYTTDSSLLYKIGSLTKTRDFISGMSNFFGGVVISYGKDDVVKYSAWDTSKIELDLSRTYESVYIENTLYVYTGKDMLTSALNGAEALTKKPYGAAPYDFVPNNETYIGTNVAKSIQIPYSSFANTSFSYSESSDKYLFFKADKRKMDMLTGKNIAFSNIVVLFANATTYEKADGTELVIDTIGGGTGYYFSKGMMTEITWSVDDTGNLIFKSLDGKKLSVNRGNFYVGYFKASEAGKVTFN